MTTATTTVVKEDRVTPADPFDFGGGRIDLTKAGDPGLTLDVTAPEFLEAGMNQEADINLNTPSIYVPKLAGTITTTRMATNVTDKRVRYRATATAPDNAMIPVTPKTFTLRPGQTVKLTITVNGVKLPAFPPARPDVVLRPGGAGRADRQPRPTSAGGLHQGPGLGDAGHRLCSDNDHSAALDRVEVHGHRHQHRNR